MKRSIKAAAVLVTASMLFTSCAKAEGEGTDASGSGSSTTEVSSSGGDGAGGGTATGGTSSNTTAGGTFTGTMPGGHVIPDMKVLKAPGYLITEKHFRSRFCFMSFKGADRCPRS